MTDNDKQTELPTNIDDIADQIIDDLNLRERVNMAHLPISELEIIEKVLSRYIAQKLQEDNFYGNAEKYASSEAVETMEVVKRVWERLRETHKLRVIK
jgi:hypothetical protein